MYLRPSSPAPTGRRRGAILIVVLALLAIFAVVAVTFVFYSGAEADAARIHKQGQSTGDVGPPDASDVVNGFLGSLVFDRGDTAANDLLNVLRGHSLGRSIYGLNSATATNTNLVPFNGVGTFHEATPWAGVDRAQIVNYTVATMPPVPGGTLYLYDPEWTQYRTAAGQGALPAPPATGGSRSYIPKNAPYTYPDANNLFLASISPQTGEVLVPSFYRSWQFLSGGVYGTANGGLEPSNPNWTNTQGRFMILRPRPQDNIFDSLDGRGAVSDFPYVPANADGTYTGDVQNLPGGYVYNSGTGQFVAKNDSIWMDIGLPPRLWNGKWIKPLVAALVLDLDGRLNLSAHGNVRNGGSHTSYAGYGPWEVSLARGFDPTLTNATLMGDANNLVTTRYGSANAVARNGVVTSRGYAYYQALAASPTFPTSGVRLPAYSQVNWDGTAGSLPQFPGQGTVSPYSTVPTYTNPGFDDNATNTGNQNFHPSLYNPAEWLFTAGATGTRAFAISDLKRLNLRFGAESTFYQQLDLANIGSPPNTSIIGPNGTRTTPAHRNRLMVTPLSATLDLPGLMPGAVGTPPLTLNSPPTINPAATNLFPVSTPTTYSTSVLPAPVLGPVDLNRPLADYRLDPTQPLSSTNLAPPPMGFTVTQAAIDRQILARDIFARLLIATGGGFSAVAGGITNGNVTIYTSGNGTYNPGDVQISNALTPGTPQFDAIRYLAQLAANIVDYIDADDISTAFVWNPTTPGTAATVLSDPSNFLPPQLATPQAAQVGNSTVFGVEKPRLVINEVYSEVANSPSEKTTDANAPSNPAYVRFWVELLNPTSTAYLNYPAAMPAQPLGPIGDGTVQLQNGAVPSYRLQIARDGGTASGNFTQRHNVRGDIGFDPDIQYSFQRNGGAAPPSVSPNVTAATTSGGTVYNPGGDPTKGIILFGPNIGPTGTGTGPQSFEFNPQNPPPPGPVQAPWTNMVVAPDPSPTATSKQNALTYLAGTGGPPPTTPPTRASLEDSTYKRNVVVLQRLANPYATFDPNLNPYITVDYMAEVPSFDSVNRAQGEMTPPMPPTYVPIASRFAVGKVQPYAGFAAQMTPNMDGTVTPKPFPNAFVLAQKPNPALANNPQHTFGRHNGTANADPTYSSASSLPNTNTETIMGPFDWLVHMDRPLANQLELLHVAGVKPHELTQLFVSAPGGIAANIRKDLAQAPWLGSVAATSLPGYDTTTTVTNNQLFRALDLLRVKPWNYGIPSGGKVHGRININTIQDQGILQALFDAQPPGNQFTAPTISAGSWIATRTSTISPKTLADGTTQVQVPVPGPTLDDLPTGGTDRPFKPFGVGEFNPVAGGLAFANGSGVQDTFLRINTATQVPTSYGGQQYLPYLWNTGQSHPYFQAEAARKILNNTTTVSNTFYVAFTVGFFEVRTDAAGTPQTTQEAAGFNRFILGKEAFKDVPGDLRQQFVAVIDRNNLTVANSSSPPSSAAVGPRPFFTTLEAPVAAGSTTLYVTAAGGGGGTLQVYADGQLITIGTGAGNTSTLVIGSGADQEAVTVSAVTNYGGGIGTITVSPTQRAHGQGDMVSNVQTLGNTTLGVAGLGNPGPQPGFDVVTNPTNNNYIQVVPYWGRVR
ncbi:MAG: hypothetical protein JWO38_8044 [Gemmataceae bacterium]|nr:hypothetical protein [Gemmataceae bacterium]